MMPLSSGLNVEQGQIVLFTPRGGGAPLAAIVVDVGPSGSNSLFVWRRDGSTCYAASVPYDAHRSPHTWWAPAPPPVVEGPVIPEVSDPPGRWARLPSLIRAAIPRREHKETVV